MQRWRESFHGQSHRKKVHIHNNGDFEHFKVLYMESDWSIYEFLNAASQRLEMPSAATRVFNADGVEVNDCMLIEDDDMLFLSINDDFIAPADMVAEESDSNAPAYRIPTIIGGYRVSDLLGRGGFGEVRVGEHSLTGEKVALKFLRKSEISSLGAAERTNTEIQCLMTLKHNNIIRLMSHMETPNHVVLVFELMEGGDLLHYLIQRKRTLSLPRPSLTEEEARGVMYQVLSAISYAHNQHICHRDLKLENILLKDNSLSCVKIADFGLSDFYRPGSRVKTNVGTLSFLAPEIFGGVATAGPPLDVWALGVILFAVLCGRLPFEGIELGTGKRPRDAVIRGRILKAQYKMEEGIGSEAKDLVKRLLVLDPAHRMTISEVFNHVWMRTAGTNAGMAMGAYVPSIPVLPTPTSIGVTSVPTPSSSYTNPSPLQDGAAVGLERKSEGSDTAVSSPSPPLVIPLGAKIFPSPSSPHSTPNTNRHRKTSFSHLEFSEDTPSTEGVGTAPTSSRTPLDPQNTGNIAPPPVRSAFSFQNFGDSLSNAMEAVDGEGDLVVEDLTSRGDHGSVGMGGGGNTGVADSNSNSPLPSSQNTGSKIKLIPLRRNNSNKDLNKEDSTRLVRAGISALPQPSALTHDDLGLGVAAGGAGWSVEHRGDRRREILNEHYDHDSSGVRRHSESHLPRKDKTPGYMGDKSRNVVIAGATSILAATSTPNPPPSRSRANSHTNSPTVPGTGAGAGAGGSNKPRFL